MKTVLVTGGTGFVGSNLVSELLRRGVTVRTFSRTSPSVSPSLTAVPEVYIGDIRQAVPLAAAMGGCDTVFHTAGIISFRKKISGEILEINAGGTRAVAEACLRAGVRRLVHTSSVAAVGYRTDGRLIDETTEFNWESSRTYRYSKHLAETEVLSAVSRGLDAVMVNPSVIVGAGDRRVHGGQIVRDAARGRIFAYAAGGMNIVAVRDVVSGEIAAAERGQRGERYILGGVNLTHREALTLATSITGRRGPALRVPTAAVKFVAMLSESFAEASGTEPLLTPDLVAGLGHHNWYSIDKARRALGYTPSPVEKALRETYDWYRQEGIV